MSKIKLKSIASAITDFDLPVEFTTTSGAEAEVVFKAKGMDLGAWLKIAQELKDEHATEAKEQTKRFVEAQQNKGEEDTEESAQKALDVIDKLIEMDLSKERAKTLKVQIDRALKIFVGWDIETDPFGAKSLERLDNIAPGVVKAAIQKYGEHMGGARRKN